MKNEFERTINASDLQEWIMCTFPDWCEGDVRLIYDHIDDMPVAQPNVQDSVKDADCISRTDAIDAISKIKRTDNWQAAVSMALLDLPSAQHERAGKWVRKTFEDWWCNQCGIEVCTETPEDYNFCPNCGAKMEGEEHD